MSETSMSNGPGGIKRPRVYSVSPDKRTEQLQKFPGGTCVKCKQDLSPESEAIQCDLCNIWVHAKCEGVSKDMYDNLNLVYSSLSNISYYCELNHCNSRIKQLINAYFIEATEAEPKQIETTPIKDTIHAMKESLQVAINELVSKVDYLLSSNSNLQMEINNTSQSMNDTPTQNGIRPSSSPPISSNATLNILDDLADRERRCKNLIAYNFKEPSDHQTDNLRFQESCSTVFKLNITLTKNSLP